MRLIVLAALSATVAADCGTAAPSVATRFSLDVGVGFKIVRSMQCGESYVLYPRGTVRPALGVEYKYFETPLRAVALTQTVSNTFIELLGATDAVKAISSYSVSSCMRKRVADGLAAEYVGPADKWGGGDAVAHASQMADVEAVFTDPYSVTSLSASASKVICAAETYEEDALASAEWIKFYGLFFDKSAEAGAAMCSTAATFSCASISAIEISVSKPVTYRSPTACFASKDWDANLVISAVPKNLAMLRHAGTTFPDMSAYKGFLKMHWSGAYANGYVFPPANASLFHEALSMCDVVVDLSWPYQQSQADLEAAYGITAGVIVPAFASGRVYTVDKAMSYDGSGSDYFESLVAQPQGLLEDLIAVAHPGVLTAADAAASTTFLRHAASASATLITAGMCTSATRSVRAVPCADNAGLIAMISSVGELADGCAAASLTLTFPQCPAPPRSPSPPAASDVPTVNALSVGAIVGIAIGGGLLLLGATVGALVYFFVFAKAAPATKAASEVAVSKATHAVDIAI